LEDQETSKKNLDVRGSVWGKKQGRLKKGWKTGMWEGKDLRKPLSFRKKKTELKNEKVRGIERGGERGNRSEQGRFSKKGHKRKTFKPKKTDQQNLHQIPGDQTDKKVHKY